MIGASMLFTALLYSTGGSNAQPARLTVVVFNRAQVPEDVLRLAKAYTLRIFARSGIEVKWLDVDGHDSIHEASDLRVVAINRGGTYKDVHVLGATVKPAGVWAFYDRIEKFVADATCIERMQRYPVEARAQVLAAVIAHELGHSFELPHAGEGLMRPKWMSRDFGKLDFELPAFTSNEAAQLRTQLSLAVSSR